MVERELISEFMANGILLDPQALDYLEDRETLCSIMLEDARNSRLPTFVSLKEVKSRELELMSKLDIPNEISQILEIKPEPESGMEEKIKSKPIPFYVDGERDITGKSTSEGELKDFLGYFRARYNAIRKLFRRRRELIGTLPIAKARRMDEVKIIGMVRSVKKWPRSLSVTLEDESSEIVVSMDRDIQLMGDEVIGAVGRMRGEILVAEDVLFPDIPTAPRNRSSRDVRLLITSDTHFGSSKFIWSSWSSLVAILNEIEPKIDFMLMAGDLVDGIGVYPGQIEELEVRDIYEQYELAASEMDRLPHETKIFLQPGNHDYVRLAEPQPALPHELSSLFSNNVIQIGNPSYLNIDGVDILSYHGSSFDDCLPSLNIPYSRPLEGMKAMLVRRHLAPLFGGKTPIAPEGRDYLVIDKIPDLFVTGHVHGSGAAIYKGVVMVNGSTFQSQTSYQRMMNFVPDPGNFVLLNLKDMSIGKVVV
jgi:DNA polymerase II small subunit